MKQNDQADGTGRGNYRLKSMSSLIVILILSGIATTALVKNSLSYDLNLNELFTANPAIINEEPDAIQFSLKGQDGGSLPITIKIQSDNNKDSPSETLEFQPNALEKINKVILESAQEKWQVIAKVPKELFVFDISLYNIPESANDKSKTSKLRIISNHIPETEVKAGNLVKLVNGVTLSEASRILSETIVEQVYDSGNRIDIRLQWFDKEGNFVSQTTGEFRIRPAGITITFIFFGFWILLVALIKLIIASIKVKAELSVVLRNGSNNLPS